MRILQEQIQLNNILASEKFMSMSRNLKTLLAAGLDVEAINLLAELNKLHKQTSGGGLDFCVESLRETFIKMLLGTRALELILAKQDPLAIEAAELLSL